ncbi:TetR family transcriptional regulator [Rhodococcus erythropolis]|uniref:TetR family transcriptional regulator n=1 Tax=Rhodococcus erythropolis TaxID=1833 RepID=A0A8I0ZZV3_RHOER|nr:TetR family transcriptional regulator [Rhodococcus erythropolis]MBH5143510.1 TetR family transcriptional regulator [Rhodococcus erythropolis]
MPEQVESTHSGVTVRGVRADAGLTLRQLAAAIGVSTGTMSAIENGKVGLTVDRLRHIAEALGVPPSHLLRSPRTEPSREAAENSPAPSHPSDSEWRVFEELDLGPVLTSAAEVFRDTGYHGATMRLIAAGADISVAGIYHHYPSKKHLLLELISRAYEDLRWRLEAAAEGSDAAEGFANMVEAVVLFREMRGSLAFVMVTEASRAVNSAGAAPGTDHSMQEIFERVAYRAVQARKFRLTEPTLAISAILTMCLAPTTWRGAVAGTTPLGLARAYADLALSMMQYCPDQHVQCS